MKQFENETRELLDFIKASPTSFHAIHNIERSYKNAGLIRLSENHPWKLEAGKSYYVTRGGSCLIAFRIPKGVTDNFQIIASHSDSPCFKIKENEEMLKSGHYVELNVEKYGGALLNLWFDRPLSVAGRVIVDNEGILQTRLIDFKRDLVMIPSLAIHMNREANDGEKIDIQKTMMPILGDETSKGIFIEMVANLAACEKNQIIGSDLFLYSRSPYSIWGAGGEYFSSSQIDDLMCVYTSAKAFLTSTNENSINLCAVFDNEEVGSSSKQGADSTFLSDTLERICLSLGLTKEQYHMLISNSFMVSADNAHALHPNYPEKADPTNQPVMNGGVVIKYNASQKYTTDAISSAIFKKICNHAEVPFQTYVNHSNIAGGSTLGNISNTHVAMNTIDIGAAQLAMHSPFETAGGKDTLYLYKAMAAFYKTHIARNEDGDYVLI